MLEIKNTVQTRENYKKLMSELSVQELNKIPEGYSNNIIWNFGHIITTQQILCYKLSELEMNISDELIEKYKKGSKPTMDVSQKEINKLIEISDKNLKLLQEDLEALKFNKFNEYSTSYNITLTSIWSAIKFNSLHESLHYGYALALRKSVI